MASKKSANRSNSNNNYKRKSKLNSFFDGRNGVDSLFYFSFILYLTLVGLNLALRIPLISMASTLLLLISIFRILSTNLVQRRKEAEIFEKILVFFMPNASMFKRRLLEARTHVFHECQYCGAVLRFERKRGKFNVVCPRCKKRLTIRNWL